MNAHVDRETIKMCARDYFGGNAEARSDAYQMGSVDPEQFDAALSEAKAEGNLSRASPWLEGGAPAEQNTRPVRRCGAGRTLAGMEPRTTFGPGPASASQGDRERCRLRHDHGVVVLGDGQPGRSTD